MDKRAKLLALARQRQATRRPGYNCIGDYHGGIYECDFVSPYTKSASNVDADVFVLLQDWSSDVSLSGPFDEDSAKLGYSRHIPTNQNLIRLLREALGLDLHDTYATNLFPFIKLGGMSSSIPVSDLTRAAREFAIPQINFVRPKLVICLGKETFNALRRVCGLPPCSTVNSGIENPFHLPNTTLQVWCQAHTGQLGRNNRNRGGVDRVTSDWRRMRDAYVARRGTTATTTQLESGVTANPLNGADNENTGKAVTSGIRKSSDQRQKPCRVVALSHGETIYATPEPRSRPDLHKEIVSFQRRWLLKKHSDLKSMQDVVYKLQWLEDDEWVFDRQ